MTKLLYAIVLIIWMIITLVLVFTIVGMFIICTNDHRRSSWMVMGLELTNQLTNAEKKVSFSKDLI